VLKHARAAVKRRENLRFARTKIFGIVRQLFRAIGSHLQKLNVLDEDRDVFYLTVEEIFSFIEGKPASIKLSEIVALRKIEFDEYKNSAPPPDRFLTYGCVGTSLRYYQVLSDGDTMRGEETAIEDPNVLQGTPCCPGVVEGIVRVVSSIEDAKNIQGEILVTERTDPGWVPLYPSCKALLIERGSLLSHSAVVARELGLPTIVSIRGGLMTKLKTGQKVRVDGATGQVRVL